MISVSSVIFNHIFDFVYNMINTVNQLKIGKMVFNWLTVFRV